MEPRTLDYSPTLPTAGPKPINWLRLGRWLVLGPVTGACVGIAQTAAAVGCWARHGFPDFYFRGWAGVDFTYTFMTVGGGLVVVVYGVVLAIFERLTGRRIRIGVAAAGTVLLAYVVAAIVVERAFRQRVNGPVFLAELAAVGCGLVLSVVTSRRGAGCRTPERNDSGEAA